MILPIRQSELNVAGFTGYFPALDWNQRKQVAAMTLNRVGRKSDAFLLEINNVNAVRGITYVADVPPLRAGR